ncbi:MAG TPA: radical SAM protein [Gemmatimonadales bacterium]|nr:radical SAM protein [Gemmatimonadales bacterium]
MPELRVVAMRVAGSSDGRIGGSGAPTAGRSAPQLPLGASANPPIRPSALPVLDERLRGTKFVTLDSRSVLNSPEQTGMDFWSINPYVGCEFGCTYCYARFAHRYVVERAHAARRLDDGQLAEYRGANGWEAFEQRIFVKAGLLAVLRSDLQRFHRSAERDAPIVIGTATDPYQPAERRFRLTHLVLEELAKCEGLSIGIITKSPLVTRDIDVLQRIQRHNDLEIHLSLIALDPDLVRVLEARSPMPAVRLRAVARLTEAGVNAGVIVAPVLPGISDDVERLDALFAAARAAHARFVTASPLRLYPGIRDRFLPVLVEHFPHLAERYRRAYAGRGAAPPDYARALTRRVTRLQQKYGFETRDMRARYRKDTLDPQGMLAL